MFRCNDQRKILKNEPCASESEINEYIDKTGIISINSYEIIDYSKRGEGIKPVSQVLKQNKKFYPSKDNRYTE